MPTCRALWNSLLLAVSLWGGLGTSAVAQPEPDVYRFAHWLVDDVRALLPAADSRLPLYAAAGTGTMLVVWMPLDEPAVDRVQAWSEGAPRPLFRVLNELGNVRGVRPAALMLFLGSLAGDQYRFQDAAFTSLEALVFANLMTDALKSIVGRSRPFQERGAMHFRPLSGNTSFPSGHATTIFAAITPWVLYYPRPATYVLMGVGFGTAFARLATNQHWFTDVLAGGAIGITTGYWLTRRHQKTDADGRRVHLVASAAGVGLRVHLGR